MITRFRRTAVLARNYAVYLLHVLWAANARGRFPLDPASDFVISVASYPARIHLVPAVFESLARQTVKPRHAYLVLSEEDYPDERVPKGIAKLVERGVEIVWTRNNPYAVKKLVPIWGRHKDCAISTFDDDWIYAPRLMEKLRSGAEAGANVVCGFQGKQMYRQGTELNMLFRQSEAASEATPSSSIYFLGGLGTWYGPESLHPDVTDLEAIHRIVPGRGSDIWFWAAAIAANAEQKCIASKKTSQLWLPIPESIRTQPKDRPGGEILEQRFQNTIDFFGIRDKLLRELPDHGKRPGFG